MSNVCLPRKEISVLLFACEYYLTVCLSFVCFFVCIGQGIQGAPGLPGIRGKPGPEVSYGFKDKDYF